MVDLKPAAFGLLKPDARTSPRLLRNELHTCGLQSLLNFPHGFCGASHLSGGFESPNGGDMHGGNFR